MPNRYLLLVLILLINGAYAAQNDKAIICDQKYALCTSAPCIPDPRHEHYAICSCDVEKGVSIGHTSCTQRIEKEKAFKVKQLVSTFSFKQFTTKKGMTCPAGTPWTDCLDAPCTVNPLDATKAICSCKIHHDQPFVTLGGKCDVDTCSNAFWSGSLNSSSAVLRSTLLKKLNITENPGGNKSCPK